MCLKMAFPRQFAYMPRGPTAGPRLGSGQPRRPEGAHLAPRRPAAPGARARCPRSGSQQERASRRPLRRRPRRRRAPARRRCKMAAGTVRNIWQPLSAAPRPGASFNCTREDTSGTRKNSRCVRPRPAHAAEPPTAPHLHGHFAKLPRATAAPTGARRAAFRWLARVCSKAACANRMERLGPSHFFIPLVLGPLNSLVW